jgi:pyrroline-5-carboxylate reductase
MSTYKNIAILGGGNIGLAIAKGLQNSSLFDAKNIYITRRKVDLLEEYKKSGFKVTSNNVDAVSNSQVVIIAVQPQQLNELLSEIAEKLNPVKHVLLSVVSGASIKAIKNHIGKNVEVVRVMPNTAIAIQESMTCISAESKKSEALKIAEEIFNQVGKTLIIDEELMIPATALCACGIAFFLRAVRAASQGGIEIGFHSEEALLMSAQTAKGAATLLLSGQAHPESEVDKVTTPRGCTISGLNQMEHNGFSSALIRGIVTSADKAAKLYTVD